MAFASVSLQRRGHTLRERTQITVPRPIGKGRDPSVFNLVQIINIDSGEISWVNADLIVQILPEPQAS